MRKFTRGIALAGAALLLGSVLAVAVRYKTVSLAENTYFFTPRKTTIRLWYDDETMTDYIASRAASFNDRNRDVRVEPKMISTIEYLETIGQASVQGEEYPDIFLLSNDSLEKAYLAGLAVPVENEAFVNDPSNYPEAAANAVTYHDRVMAYPWYFETCSLMYNRDYLENQARSELEDEALQALGDVEEDPAAETAGAGDAETATDPDAAVNQQAEEAQEALSEIDEDAVNQRVSELLPHTITDIMNFADRFDAPEGVEAVFKWDVNSVLFNYFFVGNYINVGGIHGDDASQVDLYNENAMRCLDIYQQMNQFFAIDQNADYSSILQDFMDGKVVFTFVTTEALSRIEKAQEAGECNFSFGVTTVPGLTSEYGSRSMSMTKGIVVSSYTLHETEANQVAQYFCSDLSDDMYNLSGKVNARYGVQHANENLSSFVQVYAQSVPIPKMIRTTNFWVSLEIALTKIWAGDSVNQTLRDLAEQIQGQITGEEVELERLPSPKPVSLTDLQAEDAGMTDY